MTFGGSFWQGLLWAGLLSAAVALVVGYPALQTNRHAFVIVTLAFALLVTLIARDWVSLTRGPLGIPGLPAPDVFGFEFRTTPRFYWIAWAYAVLALGFLYALCTSRIGRTLVAIKQNEPLARAQGISPMPYRLVAFAVGAALTGIAGGIFAFHLKIIDPLFLDFYYMQTFLIMVIIGGAGSFWGVVVAGAVMSALPELLRFSTDLRMIIYGAVLLVAMLVMPAGVAGWLRERRLMRMRGALQ
jgi:ABC-type branched-subunit amino acid transport system permease subunit